MTMTMNEFKRILKQLKNKKKDFITLQCSQFSTNRYLIDLVDGLLQHFFRMLGTLPNAQSV